MERYNPQDTVRMTFEFTDKDTGAILECDTGYPTITITDPGGTARVSAAEMAKGDDGTYYYDHSLPADALKGCWNFQCYGERDTRQEASDGAFEVV